MDKHAVKRHALKAISDALARATAEHVKERMARKMKKPDTRPMQDPDEADENEA